MFKHLSLGPEIQAFYVGLVVWSSAAVLAMNAAGVRKDEIAAQLGIGFASVYRILADEKKCHPKVG